MIRKLLLITVVLGGQKVYGETIDLSREQCRQMIISHKPSNSVEYTPGIDVAGNPVAPADLPGSKQFDIGKSVSIDIDLPLRKFAPKNLRQGPGSNKYVREAIRGSSIHTGTIHIDENNQTWINGQPVHDEALEEIRKYCTEMFPDL
jgi:hypothetical protein